VRVAREPRWVRRGQHARQGRGEPPSPLAFLPSSQRGRQVTGHRSLGGGGGGGWLLLLASGLKAVAESGWPGPFATTTMSVAWSCGGPVTSSISGDAPYRLPPLGQPSSFARFTRATHKIEISAKRSAYTVRPKKSRFPRATFFVTLKMQRPVQEMQRKVRSALLLPAETLRSRPHRHLSLLRWQRSGEGRAGAEAWLTSTHPLTHRSASSRRSPCAASSRASRSSPLTLAPPPSSAPSRSTRTRSTSRSASSTRSAAALTPRSVHGRDPTLFL